MALYDVKFQSVAKDGDRPIRYVGDYVSADTPEELYEFYEVEATDFLGDEDWEDRTYADIIRQDKWGKWYLAFPGPTIPGHVMQDVKEELATGKCLERVTV